MWAYGAKTQFSDFDNDDPYYYYMQCSYFYDFPSSTKKLWEVVEIY